MCDVEYRPIPGWNDYRVGSDRSVWTRSDPCVTFALPPRRWKRADIAGEAHVLAKLSDPVVIAARERYADGATWPCRSKRTKNNAKA
jgi:hypothetical protein